MGSLKNMIVVLFVPCALIALSIALAGPPVWRWGRREIVRIQSRKLWDSWRNNPGRDVVNGDPCGWLKIPSCGIDNIVISGASKSNLSKSICMESVEQEAGGVNLTVISGHRDTHFRNLRKIKEGNEFTLQLLGGLPEKYCVTDIETIPKDDLAEYFTMHRNPDLVALITCYPFRYIGAAPERFIVWCEPVTAIRNETLALE